MRISLVNVFAEAAVCDLVVEAKGKTSSASQSAKVSLKGSEVKGHSLFLSAERDAIIDTKVTCTWEPSKPAAPSAEAK